MPFEAGYAEGDGMGMPEGLNGCRPHPFPPPPPPAAPRDGPSSPL